MNPLSGLLGLMKPQTVTVKHFDHEHTGDDETQMIIACNAEYARQQQLAADRRTKAKARTNRQIVRTSRKANR